MNKEQLEVIKERYSRFETEKSSIVEAEIAVEIVADNVPALITEVERLQRFEKQVQQINNAADRLENGEIDGFDFGEIVLDIL